MKVTSLCLSVLVWSTVTPLLLTPGYDSSKHAKTDTAVTLLASNLGSRNTCIVSPRSEDAMVALTTLLYRGTQCWHSSYFQILDFCYFFFFFFGSCYELLNGGVYASNAMVTGYFLFSYTIFQISDHYLKSILQALGSDGFLREKCLDT